MPVIWTHALVWLGIIPRELSTLRAPRARRLQLGDHPQDIREQVLWNGHLRHLERDVATMAGNRRAHIDRLLLERRQQLLLDRFWRRQSEQDVAEMMGGA